MHFYQTVDTHFKIGVTRTVIWTKEAKDTPCGPRSGERGSGEIGSCLVIRRKKQSSGSRRVSFVRTSTARHAAAYVSSRGANLQVSPLRRYAPPVEMTDWLGILFYKEVNQTFPKRHEVARRKEGTSGQWDDARDALNSYNPALAGELIGRSISAVRY